MVDFSGRTIDNYLLLRYLGGGAFGEVYLAKHILRKTLFAIKILRSHLNQENLRTFLNEARIFRLVHPNIMHIRDFGIDDDVPFIVMDYLPGGTLREIHPRGTPLALKTIISYVKQVSAALQYAHDEGLVHRDVKPENMIVGMQGEIVLSDFGIVTTSYTWSKDHQGGVAGTAVYMAPEQIQARAVRASDQYALATLTYEWLVGTPPFLGPMIELTAKHLYTQPPSLRERDPTILPDIEQVVLKALAKDPAQRFPSVQEFALALEKAAKLPVGTTLQELSLPHSLLPSLAWSPDGTRLAIACNNMVDVWKTEPGATLFRSAWHTQQITAVAWSPDSSRLASAGYDRSVLIEDAQGSSLLVTCTGHQEEVLTMAWSPDNIWLASAGADHVIRIWDTATGRTATVMAIHGDDILSVAWSPDGSMLASASYDGTIQVHTIPDQKRLWMYNNPANVYALAWSPDSTRLAAARYDATVQICEATTGRQLQTYQGHTAGVFTVAWSPDNTLLASGGDDATIQIWEAATGQPLYTYRGHTRGVRAIAWSPLTGNDSYIASSGLDQVVLIWQAP